MGTLRHRPYSVKSQSDFTCQVFLTQSNFCELSRSQPILRGTARLSILRKISQTVSICQVFFYIVYFLRVWLDQTHITGLCKTQSIRRKKLERLSFKSIFLYRFLRAKLNPTHITSSYQKKLVTSVKHKIFRLV